MDYNLFSRTQQKASRNNQQHVFGNPHNNASAGYGYPSKPDGVLNRIHTAYQYGSQAQKFGGAMFQGDQIDTYQPQNDYHFYQGNYEMPQNNQQHRGNNAGKGEFYGDSEQQNPYAQQNWRHTDQNQADIRLGDNYYGGDDQWQNIAQNYQTFNNWQRFDNFAKPAYPKQNQKNRNWQPPANRKCDDRRHDRQENIEFKYRNKNDGQFMGGRAPLTYTKNLIPDISAFSRSKASVDIKKRKRSISDSDLEADISDYISEDVENSRRRKEFKGMHSHKTKSQADAEYSGLANIKIEGLIQRKLGLRNHEKKSGGPTGIDKISNGNSASFKRKPGFIDPSFVSPAKTEEREKQNVSPTNQKVKAKHDRAKLQREKAEDSAKYNKEELVATLQELIKSGKFDKTRVQIYDKYDAELGKEIKYVRINIGEITEFNDHFISVKPEAQKPPKDSHQKRDPIIEDQKRFPGDIAGGKNRNQNADNLIYQNKASFYQQPTPNRQQNADGNQKSADKQGHDDAAIDGHLSVVEQAMHKTMTGKLQRNIRKMTDEEKASLFKQLKGNLDELSIDQYGRYVLVLFLKTSITSIVDALIAYFDKKLMEIIKHKFGLLFSQSLIDLKFKDVRLRRSLKRIDDSLAELMADQQAQLVVLIYANQLPSSDMEDFVEYCKKEYRACLDNPTACRVFAKVFGKVSDVNRLEIELNLKTILPQIFDGGYGKELVEVFFTKADSQNQMPLKKIIFENLPKYLTKEEYEYFFSKAIELKKTDLIDTLMTKIFKGDLLSDKQALEILNNATGYRTILSFFTLASLAAKDLMRVKLIRLRESHQEGFNNFGTKVLTLCNNYFSAPSK
jgi:hypothetical protein